jgi:hypothetical protein
MELPGEKLISKLWETLAEKGIGSLLKPWQMVREGRAQNALRYQELLMLAQAEQDICDLRSGRKTLVNNGKLLLIPTSNSTEIKSDQRVEPFMDITDAANTTIKLSIADNLRGQVNASKAIIFAEEQLASDPQHPPANEIEEDWLLTWRDNAQKVSNEDLQRLWGSILAGELKCPGKYSIRTMDFLRTLSKNEAELIAKIARYVIINRIARRHSDYLEKNGLTFDKFLELQHLGIISGVDSTGIITKITPPTPGDPFPPLISHDKAIILKHNDPSIIYNLEVYALTNIGNQIIQLGKFESDINYLKLIGQEFLRAGFEVELADWVSTENGKFQAVNPKKLLQENN